MTFGKLKLKTKKFPKRSLYIGLIFLAILAVISIGVIAANSCPEPQLVKDYTKLQNDATININDDGYLIFKGPIDDVMKINLQKSEGGSQIIYCFDYEDDCPVGCQDVDDVCVVDRNGNILYKDNFFWGHADEIPETRVDVKAGDRLIVEESWWGYLGLEIWKQDVCEPEPVCTDNDEDGFSITGGECGLIDCNDDDSSIHPGAAELCDWIDNNCDGTTDNNENCIVACSSNADCGINGWIDGLFCQTNDIYQDFESFLCNLPGTYGSYCSDSTIAQFKTDCGEDSCGIFGDNYCKSGDVYHSRTCHDKGCSAGGCFDNQYTDERLVQDCSYGCLFGTCLFEPEPPECTQDLDCGTDYYSEDYCSSGDVHRDLHDFSCSNENCIENVNSELVESCSYDCSAGECAEPTVIECDNNADCDDGNNHTEDVCINPGEENSYCSNENIACLQNSECDDQDAGTEDICVNPGQENSYCTNEPYENILCSLNSNCGIDGYINQPVCSNGNVVQDYKTFTCQNAGTPSSSCSNSTAQQLKQTCNYGCSNGTCLPQPVQCTTNTDCSADNYSDDYCSSGDVYNDFNDYSCKQGSCVKDTTKQLVEECDSDETCSAGECEAEDDEEDEDNDKEDSILVRGFPDDGGIFEPLFKKTNQNKIYLAPEIEEEIKAKSNLWWILLIILIILIILFLILIVVYSRR